MRDPAVRPTFTAPMNPVPDAVGVGVGVGRRRLLGAAAALALPAGAWCADERMPIGAAPVVPRAAPPFGRDPAPGRACAGLMCRPLGAATVPVIGMGTWLSFDVADAAALAERERVLQVFFAAGGRLIDSSPMYGRAERVVGELLARMPAQAGALFSATKLWSPFAAEGRRQHAESLRLWRLARLDLQQVHNLLNTEAHLKTLREARERGELRYLGATTSHGRRHDELLALMQREPLDAVQLSYNMADSSAEPVIDAAAARGVAVIVNRPFDGGRLLQSLAGQPLPGWATEIGCSHWPGALLKWVVARAGITCAIPATGNALHMAENMSAARGALPDAALRSRMLADVQKLL